MTNPVHVQSARKLLREHPLLPQTARQKLERAARTARVMRTRTARLKGGWCWRLDVYYAEDDQERSVILIEVPAPDIDSPMSAEFNKAADAVFAYLQAHSPDLERMHVTERPEPRSPGWLREHGHRRGRD